MFALSSSLLRSAILSAASFTIAQAEPYPEVLYVMPLGDSLTSGLDGLDDVGTGAYRTELERLCQISGVNIDFVGLRPTKSTSDFPLNDTDHEGWDGHTIDGVNGDGSTLSLAKLVEDSAHISKLPVHLILLLVGTSDVAWMPGHQPSAAEFQRRYGRLLDAIYAQNEGVLVLATGLPPTHPDPIVPVASAEEIAKFNTALRALVATRSAAGDRVVYVDPEPMFYDPANEVRRQSDLPVPATGEPRPDGVMLTKAGYKVLGTLFYGSIQGIYWEADGLYEDSRDLGQGWRSSHFGRFYDGGEKAAGWKFLETHGWLYCPAGHASTFVFYRPGHGWFSTAKESKPKLDDPSTLLEIPDRAPPTTALPAAAPPPLQE